MHPTEKVTGANYGDVSAATRPTAGRLRLRIPRPNGREVGKFVKDQAISAGAGALGWWLLDQAKRGIYQAADAIFTTERVDDVANKTLAAGAAVGATAAAAATSSSAAGAAGAAAGAAATAGTAGAAGAAGAATSSWGLLSTAYTIGSWAVWAAPYLPYLIPVGIYWYVNRQMSGSVTQSQSQPVNQSQVTSPVVNIHNYPQPHPNVSSPHLQHTQVQAQIAPPPASVAKNPAPPQEELSQPSRQILFVRKFFSASKLHTELATLVKGHRDLLASKRVTLLDISQKLLSEFEQMKAMKQITYKIPGQPPKLWPFYQGENLISTCNNAKQAIRQIQALIQSEKGDVLMKIERATVPHIQRNPTAHPVQAKHTVPQATGKPRPRRREKQT